MTTHPNETLAGIDRATARDRTRIAAHRGGEGMEAAADKTKLLIDAAILRAETVELGGKPVRIVSRADLIEMKRQAAANPTCRKSKALRDRADIEFLLGDVPDPDEGW